MILIISQEDLESSLIFSVESLHFVILLHHLHNAVQGYSMAAYNLYKPSPKVTKKKSVI